MTQGPWSVKGIDPKARSLARERAQRQGVTLGQYLNSLLMDDDGSLIEDVRIEDPSPRGGDAGDLGRMTREIDTLAQRLETSEARSARAVSGLDKSILSLMTKVDTSGKAQLNALERVTRAMTEIDATQTALRNRIDSLESDRSSGPTLNALKTLETSLGRLADTVQERFAQVEREHAEYRDGTEEKIDGFARSIDQAITNAIRNSSGSLTGRIDQIEQQMSASERRMEGALGRIADAATRFEGFDGKIERAATDATWRAERAIEANMTRSRQMSKDVLERVDGIEEKTREAVTSLSDAVARITERVNRAERKNDTAVSVLERSVSEIDEKVARGGNRGGGEDFAQIQSLFQKRLDSLAEDLSRPIHAVRADVERKLEEVLRSGSAQPEKMQRLETALRQVQEHIQLSEARQADAVEAMSAQVERMSRAVDERLRAVEARGDQRSIEDVRREMLRLADTIDGRLGAVDALRNDIGRLNTSVDDRIQAFEQRNASAIDTIGEQVSVVAERLQRRHDENIQRLTARIDQSTTSKLDNTDIEKLADRLDERVRDSERRSAEAIGQIGEQVARVADRLQTQNIESLRSFEAKLVDSGRNHETRLSEVMADMQRRMDEVGEQSSASLAPVHKTISSLARRLEGIEDSGKTSARPAVARDIPAVADEYVILDDFDAHASSAPLAPAVIAATADSVPETDDVVGVEPPPFDRNAGQLFDDAKPTDHAPTAEAASRIEDLLETDDVVLAPATKGEFVADLPSDDARDRPTPSYIEVARRAAREGRRVTPQVTTTRKGIGKGPLIASAALAVAVAGGGVMTVMRGKQEAKPEDFAKLDPAAPVVAAAAPGAADDVLFAPTTGPANPREPAASDLFDGPAGAAPAAKIDPKAAAPAAVASPAVTLADAVASGDPVAMHDYALEILQTGEKTKAVAILKDASNRGLVMAQYRLAKLYEKGEGVPRDIAASRSWTEKAAIGGNTKAMHDLAVFYAEGDAGPQSYAAAVEWFRQASDLGLVDSQYNLAVLYEQGLGLTQDKSEAAYWFEVAGRAGDQDAARRARAMFSDMPPTQAEQIKRRARAFNPKASIARANGEFGRRAWDVATPTQIIDVQRLLERLGYSPGFADGKTSFKTEEAIRAFERDNDLPVTGEASVSLLRQLRAATLNAAN
ncbi:MAG: peptidoglycan-binding protein [Hyphomonadaceae bacterium]|nr:peptidoglycan-binding protein [Hyphomonadaceae bacterium]